MFNAHHDAPDHQTGLGAQVAGVVIKPPAGDESDIRGREASRLERLGHPGIVELIAAIAGPDGTTLHLAQVPSAVTLAEAATMSLPELLDVAKQLAEAIAYLHSTGTVHNAVTTDHVLLGDHNRLVLCGFGNWDQLGETNACVDIVAFGELLLGEIEEAVADGSIDGDDSLAISLRHLGRLAANCELTETSAQSLAERLKLLQGNTSNGDTANSPLIETLLAFGRIAGGIGLGVLVVGFAWSILRPGPSPSTRQAVEDLASTIALPVQPTGSIPNPTPTSIQDNLPTNGELVAAITPSCPAVPSGWEGLIDVRWNDLDGDSCLDPWRYNNGVLQTPKGRFSIGGPGDSFTLGDWSCNGVPTPAIVNNGLLFVFDTTPYSLEFGAQAVGELVADAPAAVSINARANGDCDDLILISSQGEISVIAAPQRRDTQ